MNAIALPSSPKPRKLCKRDVAHLLANTFPHYSGRKFRIELRPTVTFGDLNWSGGSRCQYRACTAAGTPIGDGAEWNACAPWRNPMEGATCPIPPGVVVVEHTMFCGRDCGITFHINPDDKDLIGAAPALPAPAPTSLQSAIERNRAAHAKPSVALSSGRTIAHKRTENGAWDASPTTGPSELTEGEWEEYCAIVRCNAK